LKLWGLKLHPLMQGFLINNAAVVDPICERLVSCGRKVGRRLLIVVHCMGDSVFGVPEQIGDLAEKYPDLIFVIAHMGGIWTAQSGIRVAGKYENILLDFTWVSNEKNMQEAVQTLGAKKVIVGSDHPFGSFELKMFMMDRVFPDRGDRELVLGGNLQRILDI
jgi:predicted TIM-barrel fold metal-dependent hydrolase